MTVDEEKNTTEKRPYGLKIIRNAMVPLLDEHGKPRGFGPYNGVVGACNICPARCCRYTVKVSIPDALRFCKVLGVPFFAGLNLVASDSVRAFTVSYDSRLFPDVSEDDFCGKAEIALNRREDGGCSHLVEIGGYERCGVYSARPSTCRLYPVVWESEVARGGPPIISCPVAYGMTPKMEADFYRDASESIENWQLHDELVERWEMSSEDEFPRDAMTFLNFVLSRAAERSGIELAGVLDHGTPFERMAEAMMFSRTL